MSAKVNVKEYKVKLAKQEKDNVKKYYLMRFRPPHQVNLSDLASPTLDRQLEVDKGDEAPTHGEGSEFGKKRREEARKRKYGIVSKKISPDDQPWELKEQKKGGKHFIGRKEGGVNNNSSYYVLTHCQDGTFEALPINGWYDFVPTIKYNYLDAEEAEKKFEQRHKTLNYFSVMLSKKVQSKDDDESKSESMLISDIARGHGVVAASDSDSNDEGHKTRKKGRPSSKKSSKKKAGYDDEEEDDDCDQTTDEGEMESREVDYISDDSSGPSSDEQRNDKEAEPKRQQKKQVGENLISDSSSETSEEELDDSGKAILALMKKQEDTNNSSDSDEAEEIDAMDQSQFLPLKSVKDENSSNASASTKSSKREATSDPTAPTDEPAAKKLKLSTSTTTITVDEVKYYLMRKPITATDLAKKFRSKKKDMDKMKVIARLGDIIQKNLNVERKTIQGKTYLSIKSS